MENDLLSAQEVAEILKISRNTVYELIKRGDLTASRVGKQVRINREEVERFLHLKNTAVAVKSEPNDILPDIAHKFPRHSDDVNPKDKDCEFIISGKDISLDILAGIMENIDNGFQVRRAYKCSYNGLYALYLGQVNMATAHLWDGESNNYNSSYVKKMMPGIPTLSMRIAKRKIGFFVKKGNPKKITDWSDINRCDIKIVNREPGSGSRVLLDEKLRLIGILGEYIQGYSSEVNSGFAVASAVINDDADFGIGSCSFSSNIQGIDFIELQDECFDMIIRLADAEKPQYRTLLEIVSSERFKRQLKSLIGYDISETGKIIW